MKDNPMAVKLLALVPLLALVTSHPTPPPDLASPFPSETSNVSPTAQSFHQNGTGDTGVDSKPSVEVEQFLKDMVNKMNKYRLMHATAPLVLSLNLTNKAELWAVKLANKDQEELNTNSKFGQAIFSTSNPDNAVNASVESWYNQIVHYRFDHPVANPKTNYFTQLIWKASEDVGIGKASSASGKTYIVAYFSPAGNLGDMLNNVLPVTGSGVGKRGPANCTDDYKPYNNSCFKLFPGPRTWESAVHKCTQEFASLASLDSDAENYFIKSLLTTHQKNHTWIGLGDVDNDNTFTWVDGTSNVFTKWDYQQSNVNGKKCVVVGESFNWRYTSCDKGMSFVCRRRLRDVSIYEVVFLYLNKLWTDKLLSPEEPRYKALKTHIENAIFETYRDDDWFDEVDFRGFSKNNEGRILATTRIHFTPDDDSPLDPLEKLRNRLQGGNGGESTKRAVIKGVLSGEPVEIVNTSLVIEHPQPVLCPGFCTIQNCPATTCSQSCCNQNTLNAQNPMGGLGYPGAQAQQPYQANLYQANLYQTNPYQTNSYQSNPYQGYAQSGYQSNYPYTTGYLGSSNPLQGAKIAAKPGENPGEEPEEKPGEEPGEKPGEEPEEKPEEKTKPSKEEDEAAKEPKEQSKPSASRPLRPVSRPVGNPQPYPSGYPTNYPGQSYPQQPSAQAQAYQQAAYAYPQTNPSLYQQANSPSFGYLNPSSYAASPYPSPYPSGYLSSYPSPYQRNYQMYSPYSGGISTQQQQQQQYSITEKEKPGSAKIKKGHKKRPLSSQSRYRLSPYQAYPPPSYPSTYSSGYPNQLSAQAIPQMSQYMSTSPYTSQVAGGTGYQVTYGTTSYGSPSYQGAGYGSNMAGQNPYSQFCTGACANSCAPQCNPACCRSRGLRRMAH